MTAIGDVLKRTILTTPVTRTCAECCSTWESYYDGPMRQYDTLCPRCAERQAEEETRRKVAASENRRLRAWEEICPADFLQTDPCKLPLARQRNEVMAWKFGARGLVLHGPTGKGKSRCAWLLLRREHDAGRRIRFLDHSVGFRYAEKFARSAADATDWIDRLVAADILLLDDCFKAKLTDSLEGALFTVIAARTERGRPIIVTTNDTGQTMVARMSQDRGEALLRRIFEYNDRIPFV